MNYQIKTFAGVLWIIPSGAPDPSSASDVKLKVPYINGPGLKPGKSDQDISGTIKLQWLPVGQQPTEAEVTVPKEILFDTDRVKLFDAWQEFISKLDGQVSEAYNYMLPQGPALILQLLLQHIPLPQQELKNYGLGFGGNGARYIDLQAGMRLKLAFGNFNNEAHTGPGEQLKRFAGTGVSYAYVQSGYYGNYLSFNAFMDLQQVSVKQQLSTYKLKIFANVLDLVAQGQRKHYRLYYPQEFTAIDKPDLSIAHNVCLAGASAYHDLPAEPVETATNYSVGIFNGRCNVTPEILIKLNGKPVYVAVGATLKNLLEKESVAGITPGQLTMLRYQDGQKSKVIFDGAKTVATEMYLLPGDDVSWIASGNFALIQRVKAIFRITKPAPAALNLTELTVESFDHTDEQALPMANDMAVALLESHSEGAYDANQIAQGLFPVYNKAPFTPPYNGDELAYSLYFAGFDAIAVAKGTVAGFDKPVITMPEAAVLAGFLLKSGIGYNVVDISNGVYHALCNADRANAQFIAKALIIASHNSKQEFSATMVARGVYRSVGYTVENALELAAALMVGSDIALQPGKYTAIDTARILFTSYQDNGAVLSAQQLATALALACKGQPLAYNVTEVALGVAGVFLDITPAQMALALRNCGAGYTMNDVARGVYAVAYGAEGSKQQINIYILVKTLFDVYSDQPDNLNVAIAKAVVQAVTGADINELAAALKGVFGYDAANQDHYMALVKALAAACGFKADSRENLEKLAGAIVHALQLNKTSQQQGKYLSTALTKVNDGDVDMVTNGWALCKGLAYNGYEQADLTMLFADWGHAYQLNSGLQDDVNKPLAAVRTMFGYNHQDDREMGMMAASTKDAFAFVSGNLDQAILTANALKNAVTDITPTELIRAVSKAFDLQVVPPTDQDRVNKLALFIKRLLSLDRGNQPNVTTLGKELVAALFIQPTKKGDTIKLEYDESNVITIASAIVAVFEYNGANQPDVNLTGVALFETFTNLTANTLAAAIKNAFGFAANSQDHYQAIARVLTLAYNLKADSEDNINKLADAMVHALQLSKASQEQGRFLCRILSAVDNAAVDMVINGRVLCRALGYADQEQADVNMLIADWYYAYNLDAGLRSNVSRLAATAQYIFHYSDTHRNHILLLTTGIKEGLGYAIENSDQAILTANALKYALKRISMDDLLWVIAEVFNFKAMPTDQAKVNTLAAFIKRLFNLDRAVQEDVTTLSKRLYTLLFAAQSANSADAVKFEYSEADVTTIAKAIVFVFEFSGANQPEVNVTAVALFETFANLGNVGMLAAALKNAFSYVASKQGDYQALVQVLAAIYSFKADNQGDVTNLALAIAHALQLGKTSPEQSNYLSMALNTVNGVAVQITINGKALFGALTYDRLAQADVTMFIANLLYAYSLNATVQADVDKLATGVKNILEYSQTDRSQILLLTGGIKDALGYVAENLDQAMLTANAIKNAMPDIGTDDLLWAIAEVFNLKAVATDQAKVNTLASFIKRLLNLDRDNQANVTTLGKQLVAALSIQQTNTKGDAIKLGHDESHVTTIARAIVAVFEYNAANQPEVNLTGVALFETFANLTANTLAAAIKNAFGFAANNQDHYQAIARVLTLAYNFKADSEGNINKLADAMVYALQVSKASQEQGRFFCRVLSAVDNVTVDMAINGRVICRVLGYGGQEQADVNMLIVDWYYAYNLDAALQANVNQLAATAKYVFHYSDTDRSQIMLLTTGIKNGLGYAVENLDQAILTAYALKDAMKDISMDDLTWVVSELFNIKVVSTDQDKVNNLALFLKRSFNLDRGNQQNVTTLGKGLVAVLFKQRIKAKADTIKLDYDEGNVTAIAKAIVFAFEFSGTSKIEVNLTAVALFESFNALGDIGMLAVALKNAFAYVVSNQADYQVLVQVLAVIYNFKADNQADVNNLAVALAHALQLSKTSQEQSKYLSMALSTVSDVAVKMVVNGEALCGALKYDRLVQADVSMLIANLLYAYNLNASVQADVDKLAVVLKKVLDYSQTDRSHILLLTTGIKNGLGYAVENLDQAILTANALKYAMKDISIDDLIWAISEVFKFKTAPTDQAKVNNLALVIKTLFNLNRADQADVTTLGKKLYILLFATQSGNKHDAVEFVNSEADVTTIARAIVFAFEFSGASKTEVSITAVALFESFNALDNVGMLAAALKNAFAYVATNQGNYQTLLQALATVYHFESTNQSNVNNLAIALAYALQLGKTSQEQGIYLATALNTVNEVAVKMVVNGEALREALKYGRLEQVDVTMLTVDLFNAYSLNAADQADVDKLATAIEKILDYSQTDRGHILLLAKGIKDGLNYRNDDLDHAVLTATAIKYPMKAISMDDLVWVICEVFGCKSTPQPEERVRFLAKVMAMVYKLQGDNRDNVAELARKMAVVFGFIPASMLANTPIANDYDQTSVNSIAGALVFAFDFKGDNINHIVTTALSLRSTFPALPAAITAIALAHAFNYQRGYGNQNAVSQLAKIIKESYNFNSQNIDDVLSVIRCIFNAFDPDNKPVNYQPDDMKVVTNAVKYGFNFTDGDLPGASYIITGLIKVYVGIDYVIALDSVISAFNININTTGNDISYQDRAAFDFVLKGIVWVDGWHPTDEVLINAAKFGVRYFKLAENSLAGAKLVTHFCGELCESYLRDPQKCLRGARLFGLSYPGIERLEPWTYNNVDFVATALAYEYGGLGPGFLLEALKVVMPRIIPVHAGLGIMKTFNMPAGVDTSQHVATLIADSYGLKNISTGYEPRILAILLDQFGLKQDNYNIKVSWMRNYYGSNWKPEYEQLIEFVSKDVYAKIASEDAINYSSPISVAVHLYDQYRKDYYQPGIKYLLESISDGITCNYFLAQPEPSISWVCKACKYIKIGKVDVTTRLHYMFRNQWNDSFYGIIEEVFEKPLHEVAEDIEPPQSHPEQNDEKPAEE